MLTEKLLNTDFAWGNNSLPHADTVSRIPHLIDKEMVRKSISKKEDTKAEAPSGLALKK